MGIYNKENIYILIANASSTDEIWNDNENYISISLSDSFNNSMVTSATSNELTYVFQTLKSKTLNDDIIFIYVTDHGSVSNHSTSRPYYAEKNTIHYIYGWNSQISSNNFADIVNTLTNYKYEIFLFDQCYSGGLISDLQKGKKEEDNYNSC